jgi:alpha-beta hydrolase superfamily lysophospholipase
LVAGAIVLNVLAYNHAYAMTHFEVGGASTAKPERLLPSSKLTVLLKGIRVTRPVSEALPAVIDQRSEAVSIKAEGGSVLSAWLYDAGKGAPLVVLCHGYAAQKSDLALEAKAFIGMGASVLLFDFQGSGGSTGSDTTIGVREAVDVAAAVRYANARLPHGSLILYGQSMGAVAILRAVRDGTVQPDAVILEAVFDTLLRTVRNRFKTMGVPSFPSAELLVLWGGAQAGFNGFAHRPVDYAARLSCPALFMHGGEDARVSVVEARRVFDAAPEPKAFKVFANVGHESLAAKQPGEWRAAVAPFLMQRGVEHVQ